MSNPTPAHDAHEADPIENLVHSIPVVIPFVGGLLIFLLAFIAVMMA